MAYTKIADKDYSFFSHAHKSYTQIVFSLIDSKLISNVINTKYQGILISDHSPLTMSFKWSLPKAIFSWRFNSLLLQDTDFNEYMKAAINDFLQYNDNNDVSDSTLWEAFKVVVRGKIIAYEAIKKKERRKRLDEIELQLSAAERNYTSSLSVEDLYAVMKLKYEYNTILSDQVNKQILKLKQKHFELSDKPGKLLSRQLRGEQASRSILKLRSSTGDVLIDPQDINNQFRDHFEKLYTSKQGATDDEIETFLMSVGLPKINEVARAELDSAVTINEVKDAIKSLSTGKAAGPDGYCTEFLKAYCDLVAPLILRMVKHSIETNMFPQSFYEANICLLSKSDRDDYIS